MNKLIASFLALIGCATAPTAPNNIASLTVDNGTGYTAFVVTEDGYTYTVPRYTIRTYTLTVPQSIAIYCNDSLQAVTLTETKTYTIR